MKNIRHILFLFFLFTLVGWSFFGCSEKYEGPVNPPIPMDQMQRVLKDMQIGQAGIDMTINDGEKRKERYKTVNQSVLKRHNIEPDLFHEAFVWYHNHPELLDSMYSDMIEEINLDLAEAKAARERRQKAEKDSLRNAGIEPKNEPKPSQEIEAKPYKGQSVLEKKEQTNQ